MLKKVEDFEFAENARKVFEFIFEGFPETSKPKKFEVIEGGYKCDAQIFIGDAHKNALYSIVISIFKSTGDYREWDGDLQLMKVRIRATPLAKITLKQKQSQKCIAKLYIEEDSAEWLKTRNNPWHVPQRMGYQLIMVYWRELIERWDSRTDLNEILSLDSETKKVETDLHSEPSKTWEFLRTIWNDQHQDILKRRAEVWRLWDDKRLSVIQISYQVASKATIRRDLLALAKENLLERPYPTQSQSL